MRKSILLSLSLALYGGICAQASDEILISYCGDIDAGFGEAGASVTPWIMISPEKLGPYQGCTITGLRLGLKSKASNVSVYFREDPKVSTNLYTQKAGTLTEGWQTITLDTPYEIRADKALAIGYKASFNKAGGAGYSNGKIDAASQVYVNTTSSWTEVNGAFCIEAIVSGDNLPDNEMGIISLTDGTKPFDSDETLLTAMVENLGTNPVTSLTYSLEIDGEKSSEITKEIDIPVNGKAEIEISVPSVGSGSHEVVMTIIKVNGVADNYIANNSTKATVKERDIAFMRRVVVEEGTGTWCGWCPRGAVGLEMMSQKYPDQFIGIAVHSGDVMQAPGFEPVLAKFQTFPNSITDRHYLGDPYDDIDRLVTQALQEDCHVAYSMTVSYDNGTVKTRSRVMSDRNLPASSYKFAFTVIENDVCIEGNPAYAQKNSYSGSETPMGGWQDLPEVVRNVKFQEVARAIYPTYNGETMLTDNLSENVESFFDYEFELPSNVLNPDNVFIVGLVLDAGNGFVLNGDKAKLPKTNGISTVSATAIVSTIYYDLTGRRVSPDAKGVLIQVDYLNDGATRSKKIVR
ncbi:MAG: hypothetical protein K2N05_11455 [Muribaculaceae bacterium]|nr:hypothetical protein [Muribaculaceae bacterium]